MTLYIAWEDELTESTNLHAHGLHVSPAANSDNMLITVDPAPRSTTSTRSGQTIRPEWSPNNTGPMDHPVHLHLWSMQILETADTHEVSLAWQDMVNDPACSNVNFPTTFNDFTGNAVYHFHILDHEDTGMNGRHRGPWLTFEPNHIRKNTLRESVMNYAHTVAIGRHIKRQYNAPGNF